jgi:TnpA family transposase
MAFVRLTGRFPSQQPLEILEDLLTFVAAELHLNKEEIKNYTGRQATVSEHQEQILIYLGLKRFELGESELFQHYLFQEACRLEQTSALHAKAQQFLQEQHILMPAETTMTRMIGEQRDRARQAIFHRVLETMAPEIRIRIDALLITEDQTSDFQKLKEPPGFPSAQALLRLMDKLDRIQATGILSIDLSWLNNNFQKTLARRAEQYTAYRLRELQDDHRYALLLCFLWQTYRDTLDYLVEMFDKLMIGIERRAQFKLDKSLKQQRTSIRLSLAMLKSMGQILLDETIADQEIRSAVFGRFPRELLEEEMLELDDWLNRKNTEIFPLVMKRFSYLRQFAPSLLEHLAVESESTGNESLLKAIDLLRQMNAEGKRKITDDVSLNFVPTRIRPFVEDNGQVDRRGFECALLTTLRDEIKRGNFSIPHSKRFGRLDAFFISAQEWDTMRSAFFQRAGLPSQADDVRLYLTKRLNQAFDQFLQSLPSNAYVKMEQDSWRLGNDRTKAPAPSSAQKLTDLEGWLAKRMRTIKLPDLLIEVDNQLYFTRHFIPSSRQKKRLVEDVCTVIATIMAYGCNIGPHTMSQLTQGVSYDNIKQVADWYLHEETLRQALAGVVNAIAALDTIRVWGEGKTSSSDGQRFLFPEKVLQRTYSPRFGDFALEFYSFVADNYAPFYSLPIECTDRDAAYVLDGLLYHESDLPLEEHYTDTHGYTEINFAAFALLGRRFCPRIRGLQHQWIYRIDKHKDYGLLTPLVADGNHTIHLEWIQDQWDRLGHFYASLETGHTTASTALKRLASFSPKNQFYRANRELGRIFKTEFILQYNSDASLRHRIQRGLLKGEQLHELARAVFYGKQGKVSARDLQQQTSTASCLILILASIIYWQAQEIGRVLAQHDPIAEGIDTSLLSHISPVEWDNVLLYGEYVLHPHLVR